MRELTLRGIVLGGLITLLFTAANVYLGLKVGLTFATSIPAAVISMAVLRFVRELDHPRKQYRPDHRLGGGDAGGDHLRAAGPGHDRLVAGLSLLDHRRGLRDRRDAGRDVLGAAPARAGDGIGPALSRRRRGGRSAEGRLRLERRRGEENAKGLAAIVAGSVASAGFALLAAMKLVRRRASPTASASAARGERRLDQPVAWR